MFFLMLSSVFSSFAQETVKINSPVPRIQFYLDILLILPSLNLAIFITFMLLPIMKCWLQVFLPCGIVKTFKIGIITRWKFHRYPQ